MPTYLEAGNDWQELLPGKGRDKEVMKGHIAGLQGSGQHFRVSLRKQVQERGVYY